MNVDRTYYSRCARRGKWWLVTATACLLGTFSPGFAAPQDPAVAAEELPSVLVLEDGGLLRGTLEGIDAQGKLNWLHDFSGQQVELPKSGFNEIWFDRPALASGDHDLVMLRDGTQLVGQVTSADEESLVLESQTLSTRRVDRAAVESIRMGHAHGAGKHVAGGSSLSLAEWQGAHLKGNNPYGSQVREVAGNFVFDGTYYPSVSLETKLPQKFIVTVRLDWKNHLDFRVTLGAGNEEGVSMNAPTLHMIFNERSTRLQLVPVQKRNAHVSPTTVFQKNDVDWDSEKPHGSIDFTLYVDRELQRVVAVANGELLTDYLGGALASQVVGGGDDSSICSGPWIVLQQRGTGPLRLREIEVKEWDGVVVSCNPPAKSDKPLIGLADGDLLPATFNGLHRGGSGSRTLTVTSDGKEAIELDEQMVAFVQMGAPQKDDALEGGGDVPQASEWIVELQDGSRVAADRLTYSGGAGVIRTAVADGPALDIPIAHVTRITKSAAAAD